LTTILVGRKEVRLDERGVTNSRSNKAIGRYARVDSMLNSILAESAVEAAVSRLLYSSNPPNDILIFVLIQGIGRSYELRLRRLEWLPFLSLGAADLHTIAQPEGGNKLMLGSTHKLTNTSDIESRLFAPACWMNSSSIARTGIAITFQMSKSTTSSLSYPDMLEIFESN
jgi:hypothetical protein